jgi:hypothetical protein
MIYFDHIASNLNIKPAFEELMRNLDLFAPHTKYKKIAPALEEVESIHLRIHPSGDYTSRTNDEIWDAKDLADQAAISVIDSNAYSKLPTARKLIEHAMTLIPAGVMGRAYISRLSPGGKIYPHVDPGAYFHIHNRYHIVLDTNPQVEFFTETENIKCRPGELWRFNNRAKHWGENKGSTDRYHLIFDIAHPERFYNYD